MDKVKKYIKKCRKKNQKEEKTQISHPFLPPSPLFSFLSSDDILINVEVTNTDIT